MSHRIIQTKPAKAKGETVFAYDTETPGLNAVNAVLWGVVNVGTSEEFTFYDRESFRDFIESESPCIAYAHNGNGFDLFGCLTKEECYQASKISSGTKMFEVEWNGVKYRDSKHLFPYSLAALAKTVGMEKGITPAKFLTGDPISREEITEQDVEYCLMDVRILAEAITKFKELFAELVNKPVHMIDLPLTTASVAYKVWCAQSWPEHWYWTDARKRKRPIATCDPKYNEFFRSAEAGGMVRLLGEARERPGELISGGVISYDSNSMYPGRMRKCTFPDMRNIGFVGATKTALMIELEREDRVCAANLVMSANEGAYLGLPNRDDVGRRDWNQTHFNGHLCEPEIKFALENGWVIEEVKEIVSARAIRPFVNFVDNLYAIRMEMKNNDDPGEKLCKLILNSCFGRFGIKEKPMRIDGQALEDLEEEEEYEDLLESGMLERGYYDGIAAEWPYVLDNRELLKTPSSQWFGFSSFILSHARANLGKAIVAAGEYALYTDTDSVHLRVEGRDRFESMMEIGDEIGQWKLETPDPIPHSIYWEAKVYVQLDDNFEKTLVKHKGIRVKDDDGNFKPEAGDLTKVQTTRTVVSLYEGLRRGLEPGTELVTEKKSARFYQQP
jgi:hypothetical protein